MRIARITTNIFLKKECFPAKPPALRCENSEQNPNSFYIAHCLLDPFSLSLSLKFSTSASLAIANVASIKSFCNHLWSVIPFSLRNSGQVLILNIRLVQKTQTQLPSKSNKEREREREKSKSMIKGVCHEGKIKWLDNSYTYISFSSFV